MATQLKCGDIVSNRFIANFPQNVTVKNFWKSVNIEDMDKNLRLTFLAHPAVSCLYYDGFLGTKQVNNNEIPTG